MSSVSLVLERRKELRNLMELEPLTHTNDGHDNQKVCGDTLKHESYFAAQRRCNYQASAAQCTERADDWS